MTSPFSFPLIKSSIGLSFGIIASFWFPEIPFVPIIPCFIFLLFIGSVSLRKFNLGIFWIESVLVWLFLISLGGTLFKSNLEESPSPVDGKIQGQMRVETITFRPKVVLMTGFISNSTREYKLQGLFFTNEPDTIRIRQGHVLNFQGKLSSIEAPLNPYEFNFKNYAHQQGIQGKLVIEKFTIREANQEVPLKINSKKWLNSQLNRLPNEEIEALLWAFTTGDKSKLSKEVKTKFGVAGVMHLLAVSGLHVGLIAGLPLFLLKRSRKKWKQLFLFALTLLVCWSYAWLTGFQPSVIRASLMCSLVGLSFCLNVSTNSINQLGAAATMMLVVQPSLLFTVGFQLSFAAVAGILCWAPAFHAMTRSRYPLVTKISRGLAVSFCAQAGSAPFSMYYFHQFPLLFLLANFIAIPLATLFLYTALLFLFTQAIGVTPDWLINVVVMEGEALLNWATWISEISWASVNGLWLSKIEVLVMYFILHSFFVVLAKERLARFYRPLLIMVGIGCCLWLLRPLPVYELTIFGGSTEPHIGVRNDAGAFVYYTSEKKRHQTAGWVSRFGATEIDLTKDTLLSLEQNIWRKGDVYGIGPFLFAPENEHKKTVHADGITISYAINTTSSTFYIPVQGNTSDTLNCRIESGVYDFNSVGDLVSKHDLHNLPRREFHSKVE